LVWPKTAVYGIWVLEKKKRNNNIDAKNNHKASSICKVMHASLRHCLTNIRTQIVSGIKLACKRVSGLKSQTTTIEGQVLGHLRRFDGLRVKGQL